MSVKLGDTDIAGLVEQLPSQTGNAGKYLYTDGTNASWEEASTAQIWIGTQAEYEALGTYDPEVVYQVTDDFQNLIPNVGQITEDVNDLKAHAVVEFQAPTATNNYTWYRKYADGWVEQGGQYIGIVGVSTGVSITLPVTMTDANYTLNITGEQNSSNWAGAVIRNGTRTTTGFQAYVWGGGSGDQIRGLCWTVQGMAA